jgi:hypothetical protein
MFQMDFRTKIKSFALKTCFEAQTGCGDVISLYKNLVKKHQNLTSIGSRFRSPFFLCLIQNFKAVAMCDGRGCGDCIFLAK